MKTKLTFLAVLISIATVKAQTADNKHFEISAAVNFWTPTSLHLKSSNSVTQYAYPDGTYLSSGAISGFGPSLAPGLTIKYSFSNKVGLALGFYMVNMDNELSVQKTDTTFSSYENIAIIPNFTLGVTGKFLTSEILQLFYETGVNFIPGYDLEMQYSDESSDPPDMNADGVALGVYCKTGANIKLSKSLNFKTALLYSYIPTELEYTNFEGSAKINEKSNLGGIALETGLSFSF